MPKVPEVERRSRAIKPSKCACVFSIFSCVSAGVFHNQIAAALWTEKPHSERQLLFSFAAKMSGQTWSSGQL